MTTFCVSHKNILGEPVLKMVGAIEEAYLLPGCGVGGPWHVQFDDNNVEFDLPTIVEFEDGYLSDRFGADFVVEHSVFIEEIRLMWDELNQLERWQAVIYADMYPDGNARCEACINPEASSEGGALAQLVEMHYEVDKVGITGDILVGTWWNAVRLSEGSKIVSDVTLVHDPASRSPFHLYSGFSSEFFDDVDAALVDLKMLISG